eukprot:9727417-Prorocentrum_lima.AAC.1
MAEMRRRAPRYHVGVPRKAHVDLACAFRRHMAQETRSTNSPSRYPAPSWRWSGSAPGGTPS